MRMEVSENVLTAIRRVAEHFRSTDLDTDDIIINDLPVIYAWLETREDEVIRRIKRGDNLATIRRGFLQMVAKTTSDDDLERAFLNQIFYAYLAHLREQEKRASTKPH
jgi:hypothetical protein